MPGSRITPRPRATSWRPASNCGFTRTTRSPPGAVQPTRRAGHQTQGDERQVGDHHPEGLPSEVGQCRRADVGLLERPDPRVAPESFVELPSADVDGDHRGRAPLEQAIGEPARRRPGIERHHAPHVDGEAVEGGVELLPAAADEAGGRARRRRSARPVRPGGRAARATVPLTSTRPASIRSAAWLRLVASRRRTSSASRRLRGLRPLPSPSSAGVGVAGAGPAFLRGLLDAAGLLGWAPSSPAAFLGGRPSWSGRPSSRPRPPGRRAAATPSAEERADQPALQVFEVLAWWRCRAATAGWRSRRGWS